MSLVTSLGVIVKTFPLCFPSLFGAHHWIKQGVAHNRREKRAAESKANLVAMNYRGSDSVAGGNIHTRLVFCLEGEGCLLLRSGVEDFP